MPYVAHKRLVTVIHSPVHNVYYAGAMVPVRVRARVRPSILMAEFNRIRDLPRPSSRSYLEDYLNSRYNIVSLPPGLIFALISGLISDLTIDHNVVIIRARTIETPTMHVAIAHELPSPSSSFAHYCRPHLYFPSRCSTL